MDYAGARAIPKVEARLRSKAGIVGGALAARAAFPQRLDAPSSARMTAAPHVRKARLARASPGCFSAARPGARRKPPGPLDSRARARNAASRPRWSRKRIAQALRRTLKPPRACKPAICL